MFAVVHLTGKGTIVESQYANRIADTEIALLLILVNVLQTGVVLIALSQSATKEFLNH